MQRTSKVTVTLIALVVAVSLIGNTLTFAQDDGYETVGGEVAPINFITTFLVPALVVIGILGALLILGVIRIKFESDANESA
ncbi:MAG TPA: hypothetical protein ENN36_02165 [Candidatus Bathyarchaeota archaeon]|nr:hypothetical protein [Candidatus Bathyarchaeota archaeon]